MDHQEFSAKHPDYPKKVVYIAHSGETLKYPKFAMRFVYEQGCIPLSMFEAYDYFLQVETIYQGYKALCLDDEITVMLRCDRLWVFAESKKQARAIFGRSSSLVAP